MSSHAQVKHIKFRVWDRDLLTSGPCSQWYTGEAGHWNEGKTERRLKPVQMSSCLVYRHEWLFKIKQTSWCLAWLIAAALTISDHVWLTLECPLACMSSVVQRTETGTKNHAYASVLLFLFKKKCSPSHNMWCTLKHLGRINHLQLQQLQFLVADMANWNTSHI